MEYSLKTEKRSADLMFMLGLKETIDQLAMANSVRWYGQVLRREDGHVLRRVLDFEFEGSVKRTLEKQAEGESWKVGLRRKDAPCRSKWSIGIKMIAAGLR